MTNSAEFQDNPQDLTAQFNDAIRSVGLYNNEYEGLNSALGGVMGILFNVEDEEKPPVSRQEQALMEKEIVQLLQADTLESMGIRLIDATLAKYNPEASIGAPGKLELLLDDPEKFESTLRHLEPSDEDKNRTQYGVNTVLKNTARFVYEGFYPFKDDDEQKKRDAQYAGERNIEMFRTLLPTLTERGYGEVANVRLLSGYLKRFDQGTLPDYLRARALTILESNHGPADWDIDYTGESLKVQWSEIFDFLKTLKENESPLYKEIFPKLRRDYDTLREKILKTRWKDEHFNWVRCQKLEEAGERWQQDFGDDNTIYLMERAEIEGFEPTPYDRHADPEPPRKPKTDPKDRHW